MQAEHRDAIRRAYEHLAVGDGRCDELLPAVAVWQGGCDLDRSHPPGVPAY